MLLVDRYVDPSYINHINKGSEGDLVVEALEACIIERLLHVPLSSYAITFLAPVEFIFRVYCIPVFVTTFDILTKQQAPATNEKLTPLVLIISVPPRPTVNICSTIITNNRQSIK